MLDSHFILLICSLVGKALFKMRGLESMVANILGYGIGQALV